MVGGGRGQNGGKYQSVVFASTRIPNFSLTGAQFLFIIIPFHRRFGCYISKFGKKFPAIVVPTIHRRGFGTIAPGFL